MKRPRAGVLLATVVVALAGCGGGGFFPDARTPAGTGARGSIAGQVRTAVGGVGGIRVVLVGRDSTVTGATGLFAFTNLPAATYTVIVREPTGFTVATGETARRSVVVTSSSDSVDVVFTLQQVNGS